VLEILLAPLAEHHIFFDLFRHQTFRAGGAMATALMLCLLSGPAVIRALTRLRYGQVVRQEGPATHHSKAGTPTMGGALILLSAAVATVLWADVRSSYVLLVLLVLLWLGVVGFVDDYLKVIRKRPDGLVARYKLLGQGMIGVIFGLALYYRVVPGPPAHWTAIPFVSDYHIAIWPALLVPWIALVLTFSSNAVNLTDGLDGLAAGLSAFAATGLGILAYLSGRVDTTAYLGMFYIPGAGELAIFCFALAGALLGFLWYNAHPAEVFMGDTGSLAIGGALGAVALQLRMELLLLLLGGIFLLEAISVVLQVGWFKLSFHRTGRGQRLFLMAPLHHHFEKSGWSESKVIVRFWILGIICALVALSSLRIR
jgi:phospho-N-acetylmuramoyl-pentapeptide-transferase